MSFLQIGHRQRPLPASFFPEKISKAGVGPSCRADQVVRALAVMVVENRGAPAGCAQRDLQVAPIRVLDVERDGHCCDSTARGTSRDDRTPSGLSSGIVRFGLLSARSAALARALHEARAVRETGKSAWIP